MPNSFFRFKRFVVWQDRCAMKVGTDGVLLGAWATGGKRILDIGAGTGVIAMMMAQRFPDARVDAVEIDGMAYVQAVENVSQSPFAERIELMNMSIQAFAGAEAHPSYDAIVSNPPYFENALRNPDAQRMVARHADTLPFAQLFGAVVRLLSDDGVFSAVIPAESKSRFDEEASLCGLFTVRQIGVKTTPRKPVRRYLVAYAKHPAAEVDTHEEVLEVAHGVRSEWYKGLTRDFYL